jgi:hypothetical protein
MEKKLRFGKSFLQLPVSTQFWFICQQSTTGSANTNLHQRSQNQIISRIIQLCGMKTHGAMVFLGTVLVILPAISSSNNRLYWHQHTSCYCPLQANAMDLTDLQEVKALLLSPAFKVYFLNAPFPANIQNATQPHGHYHRQTG